MTRTELGSRTGAIPDAATRRALAADSRVALLDALQSAGRPLDAAEAADAVGLHRNTARVHLEQLSEAGFVTRTTQGRSQPGRPKVLYARVAKTGDDQLAARGPAAGDVLGTSASAYRELAAALAAQLSDTEDAGAVAILAGRRWAGRRWAGLRWAELRRAGLRRAGLRWAGAAGSPAVAPVVGAPAPPNPPGPTVPGGPGAQEAIKAVTSLMDELGFGPVADNNRILLRKCPFADLAREHRTVICGMHKGMLDQTLENIGAPLAVQRIDALLQSDPLLCVVHLRPTTPAGVP
ncbi:MAG TPA: helix-turn-helix domain-containing protein [Acidimicrobiales bacterium]|nr:helix-turn-helix domain-containing protein [Acidimicrobiales bacterium]